MGFLICFRIFLNVFHLLEELPRLGKSTLIQWRERVYTAAGIYFPHNAGRHSFSTYHVALYGDASKTATLLTHRGVNMLYDHYRGNAEKEESEKYFSIVP